MAFTLKLNVMSLEDRTCLSPNLGVPLPPPPPPVIVIVIKPLPIGGGTMGNIGISDIKTA